VAELTAEGFDAEATPGSKGQFDVSADGRLVFSKYETRRFPEPEEILRALRAL
jgi:selT/selW/selH-like putative selenoprotein